jgi:hypothetical protein
VVTLPTRSSACDRDRDASSEMASELDAAALDEDVKLAMEELDLGLEGADVSMSASVLDSAIEDEDLPDEPGVESTVLDASITMEDYNAVNTSIIMEDGNTLDELEPGLVLFGVAPSAIRTADEISGQDDGDLYVCPSLWLSPMS